MTWKLCSEERYAEMLGVLPPRLMSGWGFLVGEPSNHRQCAVSGHILPDYAAFQRVAGQYYEGPTMTAPEWLKLSPGDVLEAVHVFRCTPASIAQEHAADMAACGVAL